MHIVEMKRERMDTLREMWDNQRNMLIEAYRDDYE